MKCQGKKSDGSSCQANAMTNSSYCFTHNPDTRDRHAAATKKGGSYKGSPASLLPPVELKSGEDVLEMLRDTINRVRVVRDDGSMDIATANSIGHLAGKYLECRKTLEFEAKIKELEEAMENVQQISRENEDVMYKKGREDGTRDKEYGGIKMVDLEVKSVRF